MRSDVEADKIGCSKGSRRRMAYGLAGHLVDLGRCKAHIDHLVDRRHHPKNANAVGDKIWSIFGGDNAFSQTLIQKTGNFTCHVSARL